MMPNPIRIKTSTGWQDIAPVLPGIPSVSCKVRRDAAQTGVTSGAWMGVAWDVVEYESDPGMWTAGALGNRIFAPVAGKYSFLANLSVAMNGGNTVILRMRKNSIAVDLVQNGAGPLVGTLGNPSDVRIQAHVELPLVSGDYVHMDVWNNGGAQMIWQNAVYPMWATLTRVAD